MINYAKEHMLVGPARGSSAGSLVCYLIGITDIDPIEHDLLFERFIDITRADLPDIDIDFDTQVEGNRTVRIGPKEQIRIGNADNLGNVTYVDNTKFKDYFIKELYIRFYCDIANVLTNANIPASSVSVPNYLEITKLNYLNYYRYKLNSSVDNLNVLQYTTIKLDSKKTLFERLDSGG